MKSLEPEEDVDGEMSFTPGCYLAWGISKQQQLCTTLMLPSARRITISLAL